MHHRWIQEGWGGPTSFCNSEMNFCNYIVCFKTRYGSYPVISQLGSRINVISDQKNIYMHMCGRTPPSYYSDSDKNENVIQLGESDSLMLPKLSRLHFHNAGEWV